MHRFILPACLFITAFVLPSLVPMPLEHSSTALAQPAAAQQDAALASSRYLSDSGLRLDILEAKRVSGGALLIRWRVTNTTVEPGGLVAGGGRNISHARRAWNDHYFIDPAERKKYHLLRDTGGNWIGSDPSVTYRGGAQHLHWGKFPAPPASSTHITIHIDGFEPILDVAISQ
jgi:hypothetical protein